MREAAAFANLRREGKRFASSCFQAQYQLIDQSPPRLGMAVSRRVSKRAVVRNRIRRIIRESFRAARARLPGCNVLLIARGEAAARTRSALRTDLDLIWDRLAALKPQGATSTIPPRP
jgi:ribonuclease P protein component